MEQAGEVRSARVESLRAIAALGVLVGHVFGITHWRQGPENDLERVVASGQFSVYLFFVLSGYLLFWPFARRAFGDGRRIDLRRYAVNRALRILPLYYATVVVYLLVRADGGTLDQWLLFLTFSENFSTDTVLTVNPVMWSLVIELHFYALLPLLALALARLAKGSLGRAAIAIAALGAASFLLRWPTLYDDPTPDPHLRYSLPSCFMFFAAGMLLAPLRLRWERSRPRGLVAAPEAWIAAAIGLWIFVALGTNRGYLTAPAAFLLIGACVLPLRPSRVVAALDWRPLALVGIASYSLYLWHVLVVHELAERVELPTFPALFAVAGPLCLAAAGVSYALVERPLLKLRRRWGERPLSHASASKTL